MEAFSLETGLRRLNLGRFLADVGWQATFVVGIWAKAAFALGGQAGLLAGVTASQTAGWVAGAAIGGRAVDRFGPKAVMVACQLAIGPTTLLLTAVDTPGPLLATVGALGLLTAPAYLSVASMAPHITSEPREFQRINGSLEVAGTTASICGAALGAAVARWGGADWIFPVHAALAVLAAGVTATVATQAPSNRPEPDGRLFAGLRRVYADPTLVRLLLASMTVWMAMSVFETLQPLFIRDRLGAEADALGWLHIVFAVGLIAGSLLTGSRSLDRVTPRSLPWCVVAVGSGITLFATGSVVTAVTGLVVAGLGVGAFEPLLRTGIQSRVPRERIGRVASLLEVHDQVAELAPLAVVAAAAAAVGVPGVLLIAGAGAVLAGATVARPR